MPKKKATPEGEPEQTATPTLPEQEKPEKPKKTTLKKRAKAPKEPEPVEAPAVPESAEAPSSAIIDLPPLENEGPPPSEVVEPPAEDPVTIPVSERRMFFQQDFHELDRGLTKEERLEWNAIYASYRGRSSLTGTIIGVDRHTVTFRNNSTGKQEDRSMYCAIIVPYRVRIVIPSVEMWEVGQERQSFVLQNMVGATISFVITMVDRENGFAIASRRQAMRSERHFFSHRPALNQPGVHLTCRILAVGPRRCLVECQGHDIDLTQRELRYTSIPNLKDEYHPGQELECVVKSYNADNEELKISVKETEPNPFDGAAERHPVGCRRQAVIAGKYAGGVFCNLPDNTVCLCNYSYQHEDSEFKIGDTVILVVQSYNFQKKQMYGKIMSKW